MSGSSPTFTVIIPTYRRLEPLHACLRSLVGLDYPRDCFEVIVVDDGGGLSAKDLETAFRTQLRLTVLAQENKGPGAARNTAALQAKHEYLAFIDDDCAADPGWLKAYAAQTSLHSPTLFGGHSSNALTDNAYSTASQQLLDCLYQYFAKRESPSAFFATSNLVVPRRQFLDLRGFDTTVIQYASEDREFCDRWRSKGWAMRFVPNALVFHAHALTLKSFWQQHFAYGRGAYRFRQARARRGQAPLRIEPEWFVMSVLTYPLANAKGLDALRLSLLMLLTHSANVCGFLAEWQAGRSASLGHHHDPL
jgi:GT2 family glycosyltransferase